MRHPLDPGFAVVPKVPFTGNVRSVGEPSKAEVRRAYNRAYYHAVYKPKRAAYWQRTRERDREKKKAARTRLYWQNVEKSRAEARDRARLRYATDPEYRARILAKSAKRRAMLKAQSTSNRGDTQA